MRFPDGSLCEYTRHLQLPDGNFRAVAIGLTSFLIIAETIYLEHILGGLE